MWAACLFVVIALLSSHKALHRLPERGTATGFIWLSQSFLQFVLLLIIIVRQNVISASQDARAEANDETLTALHSMNMRQLQTSGSSRKSLNGLSGALVGRTSIAGAQRDFFL